MKKSPGILHFVGKCALIGLAGALLTSCSTLDSSGEQEEQKEKKGRFDFLRDDKNLETPDGTQTIAEEQVGDDAGTASAVSDDKLEKLSKRGPATPATAEKSPVPSPGTNFYDDFTLFNGDEELSVSLVFNSAPLLDVLPAFADVLGFNFVADSDLKGVITLNLNTVMTRRELWETFDRMLYLSGAGVTVDGSLLKIMALPKLAVQPGGKVSSDGSGEVLHYQLRNSTAKDVVTQLKPFLGTNSVCVELTRSNAVLVCDSPANMPRIKQLLEAIDRSARANWPRAALRCRNILPSKVATELQSVLPVLGFTVTRSDDKTELPGAIQLLGIDRLQMLVVSAATEEALAEIRSWVEVLDSADSLDQERVFVYKVAHGKAAQLAQALSVIYDTSGSSLTIDTSTGDSRTDSLDSTRTNSSSTRNNRTNTGGNSNPAAIQAESNTETDQSSSVFETPVRVFADGVLNRLVIRTTPRTYASIKALLRRLDVVPSQVLLQVLVVEVTLTESTKFGLEFSAKGSGSGADSLLGTNYNNLNPFGENPESGFTYLLSNPNDPQNKFGYIRAMAGNNAIKVVSSPQLLVSSHTEATISVGSEVPIITGGITNSSSSGDVTQTYEYKDTGVILTITPQVTSTDLISLEVTQELSTATTNTTSATIDSPEISKREIQTAMTIANGRTMIIGGLIQEKHNDDLESVPFVNEIPILRRLFGSTDAAVERSEILVLITGYIVNEKSPVEEMIKRYDEALRSLNNFDESLGDRSGSRTSRISNKLDSREFWE